MVEIGIGFDQALMCMKEGYKMTRTEIMDNVFIRDHCFVIYKNEIYKTFLDNGLMCAQCPTSEDILANDWFIYHDGK